MAVDTPAVVLGAGINGLGVARSLGRARVPVWLLDTDARHPAMRTRAAKALRVPALHGEALIKELVHLGSTRFAAMRPVLLLTQEESVMAVSRHREQLAQVYRFTLPSPEIVDALLHKHGFQRLAERFGAPIPKLVHVASVADLPALENLGYPVVIKPGARNSVYSRQFKKAYRVQNAAEADALVRRILPVLTDVVVQEWTEGPDSNIHFCLQYLNGRGQIAASFTGRKVRSWPPQVGGTASCMPAPQVHTALSDLTTQFFRNAGVVGMAGMEYKLDAASGEFRMVEPTIGRTDYQAEIATLNGVNLPYAAYCAELGITFPAPGPIKSSLAWRVRSEDQQSAAAQQQLSSMGFTEVDGIVDALWRCSDPAPYLFGSLRRGRSAFGSRAARIMPLLRTFGSKP